MSTPRSLPPACRPGPEDAGNGCSICGDEGREGTVVRLLDDGRTARVRLADGDVTDVALDLLHAVRPGDRLIVHLGFAIATVREGSE